MFEPTTSDAAAFPVRRSRPLLARSSRRAIAFFASCVALMASSGCGESPPALPTTGFKIVSLNPSMFALGYGSDWRGARYQMNFDGTQYIPGTCTGTTEVTPDRGQMTLGWTCQVDFSFNQKKFLQSLEGTLTYDREGEYEGPVTVVVHTQNPDRVMTYELVMRIQPIREDM